MKKLLVTLIAATLVLTSCSSGGGENLDAKAFATKIAEPGVVVLDVRTAGEFLSGHINGAINIDVEAMDFDSKIALLDKSATYAVYCHSGRRSGIAVGKMKDAGFTKLFNLKDGIQSWVAAGNALAS